MASRARVAVALLGLLACAAAADASDRSERLYSRALVEFHAGRTEQARALLDEAVTADPQDPYALYYRGTIRGRLGDLSGAVADLRAALQLEPDFDQAALDLGTALLETGDNEAALTPLEQATRRSDLEAHARLYLGIAQVRAGRLEEARTNLTRAADLDPSLGTAARYYLGIASQRAGDRGGADAYFTAVSEAAADSAMRRHAQDALQHMRAAQKPWTVYGTFGFQYDSNVVLAGEDVGISNQDDGLAVIGAGAAYGHRFNDNVGLSVGYEFFQSLHFDLNEFDLQGHRPEIRLLTRWNRFRFGVLTRYDFYLRDTSTFLNQFTASPWASMDEGDVGRVEVYYRIRLRDFLDNDFDNRDAVNQAPGIRQIFYLGAPERYVSVGYQFDREDPNHNTDDANQFAYDGQEVNCAGGWTLPFGTSLLLDYAFRREQYPKNSQFTPANPTSEGRRDKVHELAFTIRQPIGEYFRVVAGYYGTFNGSNDPTFDYDRHIGSIGVEVSL
jgi:tetratricopeptide (TPR) repeat protein